MSQDGSAAEFQLISANDKEMALLKAVNSSDAKSGSTWMMSTPSGHQETQQTRLTQTLRLPEEEETPKGVASFLLETDLEVECSLKQKPIMEEDVAKYQLRKVTP